MLTKKLEVISIFAAIICLISVFAYNLEGQTGKVEIYKAGRRFQPGQKEDFGNTEAAGNEEIIGNKEEAAPDITKYLNQEEIKKMGEIIVPMIEQGNYTEFYANYMNQQLNIEEGNIQ